MDTQWTIAITEALDLIGGGEVARFSVKGSQSSCRLTRLWFLPFVSHLTPADNDGQF